jgi:hypothetical protein
MIGLVLIELLSGMYPYLILAANHLELSIVHIYTDNLQEISSKLISQLDQKPI